MCKAGEQGGEVRATASDVAASFLQSALEHIVDRDADHNKLVTLELVLRFQLG